MKNLEVNKKDIVRIGHTVSEYDGKTVFVCDATTSNMEYILLRDILKCYGEQYRIVDEIFVDEKLNDVILFTNLPKELCIDFFKG